MHSVYILWSPEQENGRRWNNGTSVVCRHCVGTCLHGDVTSWVSVVVRATAANGLFDAFAALTDHAARTTATTDAPDHGDYCDHDQNSHQKVPPFGTAKHTRAIADSTLRLPQPRHASHRTYRSLLLSKIRLESRLLFRLILSPLNISVGDGGQGG